MSAKIAARLHSQGKKRMLALDGGGTRGIITIAFLKRIEAVLAERFVEKGWYARPEDFRLCHYFDLIGGTSVGSMLAAQLALGHSVSEIETNFEATAKLIFSRPTMSAPRWGIFKPQFEAGPVTRAIKGIVQDECLDSDKLRTGLAIIMKRMDTGSVWPLVNNPAARYWDPAPKPGKNVTTRPNKDYKLWELIRSSTAAPKYFSAKEIGIYEGLNDGEKDGHFIDGAVSPHNSPALMMFMLGGIKGYNLGGGALTQDGGGKAWELGDENLLLISVGTGTFATTARRGWSAAYDAIQSLQAMISDGTDLGLTLLQWLGTSKHPWRLDRELRTLAEEGLDVDGRPVGALLSFQRYDLRLEEDPLNPDRSLSRLKETPSAKELGKLREFTDPSMIPELLKLAAPAATEQVRADHFPAIFDSIWQEPGVSGSGATDRFPT